MKEKVKRLFRRDNTEETHKIPKEWLETKTKTSKALKTSKSGVVTVKFEKGRKIHVPGLRQIKRLLAGTLLIFNFFVAQASLMSAAASQPLSLFFYLNTFVLIDYLWKTRKKSKPEWGK